MARKQVATPARVSKAHLSKLQAAFNDAAAEKGGPDKVTAADLRKRLPVRAFPWMLLLEPIITALLAWLKERFQKNNA